MDLIMIIKFSGLYFIESNLLSLNWIPLNFYIESLANYSIWFLVLLSTF